MKVSQILEESEQNFGITNIISDIEFKTLGLIISDVDMKFCTFLDDPKYINKLKDNVSMVITTSEISKLIEDKGICISSNPRISFFKIHNYLADNGNYKVVKDFDTQVGKQCSISNLASIAKRNVRIGDNVIIEEFVSIKENTEIGDNTIIRSGTVIGSSGYEFKRYEEEVIPIAHLGKVQIGRNVEIKHNSCIDKAIYPWDSTIINDDCKISNLVNISHGVKIGKSVFVTAGSLIGGRTVVEDKSWVGLGTIISNGLNIGKSASLNIGSVVTTNIVPGESVSGNFAINHNKFIEFIKTIR